MSNTKYVFNTDDFRYEGSNPVSPQKIGEELEGIQNLTPKKVVDYGKAHPESEVAKFLEWNNPTAAYLYRHTMAERLIKSLVIVAVSAPAPRSAPLTIRIQAYHQDVEGTFVKATTVPAPSSPGKTTDSIASKILSQADSLANMVSLYRSDLGLSPAAIEHLTRLKEELEAIVSRNKAKGSPGSSRAV